MGYYSKCVEGVTATIVVNVGDRFGRVRTRYFFLMFLANKLLERTELVIRHPEGVRRGFFSRKFLIAIPGRIIDTEKRNGKKVFRKNVIKIRTDFCNLPANLSHTFRFHLSQLKGAPYVSFL